MMGCFGGKRNEKDKIQSEKNKEIEKSLEEERKKIKSTHSLLILGKWTWRVTSATVDINSRSMGFI